MFRFALLLTVLLISTTAFSKTIAPTPPAKIITVIVDAQNGMFIGRDTVETETIPAILSERLWKSYLGTGKMYDAIKVTIRGEVLMGTRGAVYDAIQQAQQLALKKICLQKYKHLYEELSAAQQRKVRSGFKVLFQQTF